MILGKKYKEYNIPELETVRIKTDSCIVCITVFLVLVLICFWIYFRDVNTLIRQDSFVYIDELAMQNSQNIENIIESDITMLEAVAMTLSEVDESQYDSILNDFNKNPKFKLFNRFGIISNRGITEDQVDLSDRKYFKMAMAGIGNLSEPIYSRIDGKKVQVYAIPIIKRDDILGVLTATITVDTYQNILFTKILGDETESFILDKDGNIMISTANNKGEVLINNIFSKNRATIQSGTGMLVIDESEGKYYINIQKLHLNDWYVGVLVPHNLIEQKLKNTVLYNTYSSIIAIILLCSLSLYIIYIQRRSKRKLIIMAYFDEVTGYPNKNLFISKAESILLEKDNTKAYVILDIKQFKLINDKYGYKRGNELLIYISKVIYEKIDKEEIFSRFSADKFHMLIGYKDNDDLEKMLEEISNNINNFKIKNNIFDLININYGVKLIEESDQSIHSIGDKAMIALEKSKKGNLFVNYYNEEMRQEILEEQFLESQTKKAFIENEFKLYIQPKYDIENNDIIGGEALVRWENPDKGIIFPDKFIPLFEKNGDIIKLDEYMLHKTCDWIKSRIDRNLKYFPISVNQSRLNMYSLNHIENFTDIVDSYQIPRDLIEMEITENMFLEDLNSVKKSLEKLHSYGFKVSMDDFGAGHSSLNVLQDINVDVIKLDRKFCSFSGNEARGKTIIKNIVSMAKELNIDIIAEGVEFKEQAEYLKSIGCKKAQGYYYSRPITVEAFERLLEI